MPYTTQWATKPFAQSPPHGTQLEFTRSNYHFPAGQASQREGLTRVVFKQPVVFAEVFLSGFNMWYTGRENDHALKQQRVDAHVNSISGNEVEVKLTFMLTDSDPSNVDDVNECWIGFTVIALTTFDPPGY
ncbi:MAG: hypothetical protein DYG89_29080 [Caldilinea sp. CFX5]|nr:hypothetical protein [Caldilinea sp. CFX5]